MPSPSGRTLGATCLVLASLAASACASSAKKATVAAPSTTAGTSASTSASAPGSFAKAHYTTDLTKVCPNPVIIQKDWYAEAEHGGTYQMIGGGGKMEQNRYTGPLGSTGINLEILDAGAGLGDGVLPITSLFAGNLVQNITPTLAYVGTDDLIQFSKKFPATAVVAPLNKSPNMLMYDPSTYSSITTIQNVIDSKANIYVTSKSFSYVQYLIGKGVPDGRFIAGYAGDKEKFITSGGKLINQGYVSNEVYSYEHETPTWNKPVGYVLVDDLGYRPYPSTLAVRTDKLPALSSCLQKLVPIIQQAQADYAKDPTEVNTFLAEYNPKYSASFWKTSKGLSDAAVKVMLDRGVIGNDEGTTLGATSDTRTSALIDLLKPILTKQGIDTFKPDISVSDIQTNQFIDKSIKLAT